MNGKAMILAAMTATLMLGASAQAFARNDDRGPGPGFGGRQAMFVNMLQEFDADKNGQISKDEAKGAAEKLFAAVDTDTNGALTPGEMRKYRETKMDEWRKQAEADAKANPPQDDDAAQNDNGPQDGAGNGPGNGPGMGNGMGNGMGPGDGSGPMAGDQPRNGRHHGWRDGDGPRHGWGGPRDGKHMRGDADRGPGAGPDGPMGGRMMRQADTDENGQISKEEALAMLDKAFTRMDRNSDGSISPDDFPKRPMWFR